MEDDDYKARHFTYYSRIVMIIVTGIELILFIVFIVIGHNIQSIMNKIYKIYLNTDIYDFRFIFDEQTQAIDTCFAFFVIAFAIFLVEFIVNFGCGNKECENGLCNKLFNELNHLLIILIYYPWMCCASIPLGYYISTFKGYNWSYTTIISTISKSNISYVINGYHTGRIRC